MSTIEQPQLPDSHVKYCFKHSKEQTVLCCGRCDRPICTRCMVSGPAGVRCRDCASMRSSVLYKVSPVRLFAAALVAVVLGTIGGFVLMSASFFLFFIGPIYGGIMAEAVLRITGRKQGPAVDAVAIGGIVIGAGIAFAVEHSLIGGGPIAMQIMTIIWPLIGLALAIGACYYRMR